ncbi:aminopeptidase N [Oceanibacterium hippocampi]|uniref:Aminopeptidase N n=1 Tax=Oceanibacterium hippocampi TaxID=745714 RepID=A0A1Y5TZX5_9PROT|nr:aminopeptidase N [Oceanibacterium hippocampi]SLN77096.1 Aminopeptidase N [Oceanibacterium hippocampi]
MPQNNPDVIHLEDYRVPDFLIEHVELHVDLGDGGTRVGSRLTLRRNGEHGRPLVLHGEGLELLSIALDGKSLAAGRYRLDDETLTVEGLGAEAVLETECRIDPDGNTALEGLYRSNGTFCTQCEAEGFRKITWYLDRPDVMARFRTTIVGDRTTQPVMLSNGNPVASGTTGDNRHWVTWEDPFPKPSYLFALVAGDLAVVEDSFTTRSGREVALRIYVEHGNEDRCGHAMTALKHAMAWDERVYGREYDLDIFMIVAVSDFNMGAMENKGLNVFNAKYILAKPETATDVDFDGIESVVAHEYFHNWTGNRVTCRDWFQLTLKEGLTVFRDQQFSADMNSAAVKRIADVQRLRAAQFPEDGGPLAHPIQPQSYIEINNFYTATVYEKGAEVIRMIHRLLGTDGFRKGSDLYFERHDGQAVTTEDFVAAMEDANDADLGQFRRWYVQAGTPRLICSGDYDAADGSYLLTVRQETPATPGQPEKAPLHMPFAVGLIGRDGADLPLRLAGENSAEAGTRVLQLREAESRFRFVDIPERPVASLLRGFSAPVRLEFAQPAEDLAFRMAHDSDDFNRWEAAQELQNKVLLGLVADRRAGRPLVLPDMLAEALGTALDDDGADPSLLALMLTLPGEVMLAQHMEVIDVEAIHDVREFAVKALAERLRDRLLARYRACHAAARPGFDGASMAARHLQNACLAYLSQLDDIGRETALAQYRERRTMTETMAALARIAASDWPERDEALADFHAAWRNDPLVIDKWFTVQATAARADTLEHVLALAGHEDFTLRNPNRVRALIGAFASANPTAFHRADGAGYDFVAERILALDASNPQVAARLIAPFGQWRRYDKARQERMLNQLKRIVSQPGLSKDVREVASKSLN